MFPTAFKLMSSADFISGLHIHLMSLTEASNGTKLCRDLSRDITRYPPRLRERHLQSSHMQVIHQVLHPPRWLFCPLCVHSFWIKVLWVAIRKPLRNSGHTYMFPFNHCTVYPVRRYYLIGLKRAVLHQICISIMQIVIHSDEQVVSAPSHLCFVFFLKKNVWE